jgi:hypothetical protein
MQRPVDFLFGHWAASALTDSRGPRWRELVSRVVALDEMHQDALAFDLLMIQLNGCLKCNSSHYHERGGCANCARLTLGMNTQLSEDELLARFRAAQIQVANSLQETVTEGQVT